MSTIAKVAYSNNKQNPSKSILTMLSIFLSTVLLTVICTYAYGLTKQQKANASTNYGSFYGICSSVTPGQLQEMQRRSEFSVLGLTASVGLIQSPDNTAFMMADQNARDLSNQSRQLASGAFPQAENEIAARAGFFESLGFSDIHVGDTVSISYRKDLQEKYQAREFIVSGILKPRKQENSQAADTIYASQAFYEAQFSPQERRYSVYFRLADHVPVTYDDAEEVLNEIAKKCGIDAKQVIVNSPYLLWTLDPGYETMSICAAIALIVILLSIVVIYNIFQVGIAQKIQEYGKIRALGATKKQMRQLIYYEGMFLAAGSIPAGVLAGFAMAWAGYRWLMQQTQRAVGMEDYKAVSLLSIPVLLFGALLAFAMVWLALRKPMKIVSRITPIEAVRYLESPGAKQTGIRKGRKKLSVSSLAFASLSADRKRTIAAILQMGLSCVLFVVLANCVGNIDAEYDARNSVARGQFQIMLDYSLQDKAYPENNLDAILKNNPLNAELLRKIKAIQGVTDVQTMDILLVDVNGTMQTAAVFDEDFFNWEKNHGGRAGELDYRDSLQENIFYYCWSSWLEGDGFAIGQDIAMELTNGTDTCQATGTLKGSFGSFDTSWALTREQYERMGFSNPSTGWIWVDCKESDAAAVRQSLEQLLSHTEHVEMTAYEDALDTSRTASSTMKLACYLFLAVIGLIGFMNFANTMIMNIITKKQEYGILQAVGMTNRQLNSCLQLQGLFFTLGTAFTAILAGLPAGYGIFVFARKNAFFGLNVYHVPFLEMGCMIAVLVTLQAALSFLLSRNLKKESLIDRIRYHE